MQFSNLFPRDKLSSLLLWLPCLLSKVKAWDKVSISIFRRRRVSASFAQECKTLGKTVVNDAYLSSSRWQFAKGNKTQITENWGITCVHGEKKKWNYHILAVGKINHSNVYTIARENSRTIVRTFHEFENFTELYSSSLTIFCVLFNILFKVCKGTQLWNKSENIYNIIYFYIYVYTRNIWKFHTSVTIMFVKIRKHSLKIYLVIFRIFI